MRKPSRFIGAARCACSADHAHPSVTCWQALQEAVEMQDVTADSNDQDDENEDNSDDDADPSKPELLGVLIRTPDAKTGEDDGDNDDGIVFVGVDALKDALGGVGNPCLRAKAGPDRGHHQSPGDPLAGNIAQHDRQTSSWQLDVVVIVAANLVGRLVKVEEVIAFESRRRRRHRSDDKPNN